MTQQTKILVVEDAGQLAKKGADRFCRAARKADDARGRFVAAISGGSTPRAMHRLIADEPYLSAINWDRVHLFWVDERLVSTNDPASNYGAALSDFLDRVPIPPGQVYPMIPSDSPPAAAAAYQNRLQTVFGGSGAGFPVFDQIFLGVGTDGHTASIFPKDSTAIDTRLWVAAVRGGRPDVHRLTLTLPVLNHARSVVFLVSGSEKASIVKKILTGATTDLPAGRIQPADGRLFWIMDQAAAGLLPQADQR